jgi:hypothetical protein
MITRKRTVGAMKTPSGRVIADIGGQIETTWDTYHDGESRLVEFKAPQQDGLSAEEELTQLLEQRQLVANSPR